MEEQENKWQGRTHRGPKPQPEGLLFGIRAVMEAIRSEKQIDRLLIKRGLQGELFGEFFKLVRDMEIPFQYVPEQKLNRITAKNHQGVIAFISPITFHNIQEVIPSLYEEGKEPMIMVLDRVSDVRNFGAIARSAEVAGAHAIVVPEKGAAAINADAVKTSAGALHHIKVCKVSNLVEGVEFLQASGLSVVAASEKTSELYYETDLTGPLAIVLGSEGDGVDNGILRKADKLVKIPQQGVIDSLNVSVAASILLFDAVRQRKLMQD